jgi:cytochrome P450
MDCYIKKALHKRFKEIRQRQIGETNYVSRSAISLVLQEYLTGKTGEALDPEFLRFAIPQIRVFLFAGHDTTTSIMVYAYHVLSKRADILGRMRDEHTKVFGNDLQLNNLRENPSLLNQLPYTMAVIKETMRMYPPAGSMRQGVSGAHITDRNGTRYPTEGMQAAVFHIALHHNPRVWVRPLEFIPERWLAKPGDPLYPPDNGFRAFELGPRNCIGQDLAQLEIRLVLVMTIREFGFTPAYEKWDTMRRESWVSRVSKMLGVGRDHPRPTVNGERVYPVEKGGAHPADGYPCEVNYVH